MVSLLGVCIVLATRPRVTDARRRCEHDVVRGHRRWIHARDVLTDVRGFGVVDFKARDHVKVRKNPQRLGTFSKIRMHCVVINIHS